MDAESTLLSSSKLPHGKQAACLNCRRSKIRCNRNDGDARCEKCKQSDLDCVVPNHHVGRQKGVKNKRKGVDKALHQIEQAIKRPKLDVSNASQKIISDLQDLLNKAQGQSLPSERDDSSEALGQSHDFSPKATNTDDNLALDDAENPLQLLARASDLQLSPGGVQDTQRSPLPLQVSTFPAESREPDGLGAKSFFVPVRASRDIGPDLDPIDVGLVTLDEAESLFTFFYQNLAHTRWGLDPLIHSVSFVRSQSAFLLTSVLAAAALFLPSAAALSKRLSRHCNFLAHRVTAQRYRSVEIVLAFMVNVPWMAPGTCLGDDDTCSYIAMALTVALDLSLSKIVTPSSVFDGATRKRIARADCIDAKRALHIDGFDDVDPESEWGRRLLRRRERTWIALFVVERGVCLARGRSYTVPTTTLLDNCDHWHISDIADPRDGPMTSMAVLRRDLDELFNQVKLSCDSYHSTNPGSEIAQSIETTIESFYDRWYASWAPALGEGQPRTLPPYVEILVTHTRLSTYGGVINHPTAPLEVKRFFRAAGLSSALNVMRAAIQGESRLKSMPNNTVIMISFAACSALSLGATSADSRYSLAPSVQNLVEETADVLERIGVSPSHRNGASVLYGRFLRALIRRVSVEQNPQGHSRNMDAGVNLQRSSPSGGYGAELPTITSALCPEPLQFSAMSDDQIIDAVNRAGTTFGTTVPDIPLDDILSWDWFDLGDVPEFGF